jgi:hypothetical protein
MNTNNDYIENLDSSILTESEPISILQIIHSGEFSRYNAWQTLQLVHDGEIPCNLAQYGILTVFSLSKDFNEFKRLFEQGCDMLREEGILNEQVEKKAFIELSKKLKGTSIKKIKLLDKSKKSGKKKKNPKNNN